MSGIDVLEKVNSSLGLKVRKWKLENGQGYQF